MRDDKDIRTWMHPQHCDDSSYQVFGIAFSYALHILTLEKNRYLDNGGKGATAGYGPMKGLEISGHGRILWIVCDTIDGMY